MYRVLVVDDEEMIAEGMKLLIEQLLPECQVIAAAYDGTEGLEIAMEQRPDIILTDVRMCEMDGIEMIRRLKDSGIEAHYIILSGYAEFEYAKQAIALGVEDYITKPVEEEELCRTFQKVCTAICQEKKKIRQLEELRETVGEYTQSMREYYLRDILNGRTSQTDHLPMDAEEFFQQPFYLCAVFEYEFKDKTADCGRIDEIFRKQCEIAKKQYAAEVLAGDFGSRFILVLGAAKQTEMRRIKILLGEIRFFTQEESSASVCAGIGLWHKNKDGMKKSCDEALCALNYKVINGAECLVSYDEIRNITPRPAQIPEQDVRELERCINEMDNDGCRKVIEKIFRNINADKTLSPENLQMLAINLILSGIRKMPFMQLQINEYLGRNILSLESIAKFKTMEQLKNWIINVICGMNELMLKQNLPEKRDVVKEVQEYISRNFSQEISLADIAEKFFINPYYFSQLFKKKTGETYQNYLTGVRISRAKKLLEETDLKMYEICELVGYTDVSYFSRVFEKREGIKPSNYRKNISRQQVL